MKQLPNSVPQFIQDFIRQVERGREAEKLLNEILFLEPGEIKLDIVDGCNCAIAIER